MRALVLCAAWTIGACSYPVGDYTVGDAAAPDGTDGANRDTPPTDGCAAGLTDCSGACVDLTSDKANCGDCGHACDPGNRCHKSNCI